MTVTTPMAGILQPGEGGIPVVGKAVRRGQALFKLTPFLAPERDLRVQLERDVATLTERVAGVRQRKERAEILAQEKAGSMCAFEEAQAELAVAEAELKGARERLARFDKDALESDFSVEVTAPISGIIQKINATPGVAIAGGAMVVEIANLAQVWIRVPVYVGDLPQVVRQRPARVHDLSGELQGAARYAQPVNAPPSADASAATADLYFALVNGNGALRPGQRVGVTLPLRTQEQGLVIPWSAVLHDIQGATWVYENTAPQTFVRRSVAVKRVSDSFAVLGQAPPVGAKIVTIGAAELFGTEFGVGK
jgi:membrane fusion protein, heavy metal efflux system